MVCIPLIHALLGSLGSLYSFNDNGGWKAKLAWLDDPQTYRQIADSPVTPAVQSCLCIKDRSHLSPTNSSVIQRSVVSTAQSIIIITWDGENGTRDLLNESPALYRTTMHTARHAQKTRIDSFSLSTTQTNNSAPKEPRKRESSWSEVDSSRPFGGLSVPGQA